MDFTSGTEGPLGVFSFGPLNYKEDGMTVTSLNTDLTFGVPAPHIHLDGGGLFNHGGCCSTPYKFELNPGGSFDLVSFNQGSIVGTDTWTASSGGTPLTVTSADAGSTVFFPAGFTGITSATWNTTGSSTIDNLKFLAEPAPSM